MSDTIIVQTSEGKEIPIKKSAAMLSNLLKREIEKIEKEHVQKAPFVLTEVNEKVIGKIYEYLENYNGKPPKNIENPLQTEELKNVTDKFSADFIDQIPLDDLINLTYSATYMEINPLIDLCCAKLACKIQNKEEEEIFKVFNINETFTEEEKKRLREENKWIEENLD